RLLELKTLVKVEAITEDFRKIINLSKRLRTSAKLMGQVRVREISLSPEHLHKPSSSTSQILSRITAERIMTLIQGATKMGL
ncbi:hypothetical protein SK128_022635, partial [Halocaridina rubra]